MQLITLNISRCVHCHHLLCTEDDKVICTLTAGAVNTNDTCSNFSMSEWIKQELKETLCFKDNEIGSLEQIKEMENAISKQK